MPKKVLSTVAKLVSELFFSSVRGKGFILAHDLRTQSLMKKKPRLQELKVAGPV